MKDDRADKAARPCRKCRHLDCMMDRGEPMPDWVVAYQDGKPYAPNQTTDDQAKDDTKEQPE